VPRAQSDPPLELSGKVLTTSSITLIEVSDASSTGVGSGKTLSMGDPVCLSLRAERISWLALATDSY
jgi:hypothetical protein